jgi:hypothetical protein
LYAALLFKLGQQAARTSLGFSIIGKFSTASACQTTAAKYAVKWGVVVALSRTTNTFDGEAPSTLRKNFNTCVHFPR